MSNFKVVVSDPKTRKAYQKEVEQAASGLLGKKIGEKITANTLGMDGYSIEITGGSDGEGFPMRADVEGSSRKRIVLAMPPGYHPKQKGQRKRKSIRGNTVSRDIVQINARVVEYGKKSIEELLGAKKEAKTPAEEKPAKKPAEKSGEKKEATKEEKPAEKVKEAPKDQAEKTEEKMGVKELKD